MVGLSGASAYLQVEGGWDRGINADVGRYEWSDFDSPGVADLSVVTVGVVRYYNGNLLRWTTDVGVGLNPVDPAFASPRLGWRADAPGEDGQVVVRSQLQLLF